MHPRNLERGGFKRWDEDSKVKRWWEEEEDEGKEGVKCADGGTAVVKLLKQFSLTRQLSPLFSFLTATSSLSVLLICLLALPQFFNRVLYFCI